MDEEKTQSIPTELLNRLRVKSISEYLDGMEKRPKMYTQSLGSLEDTYLTLLTVLYDVGAWRPAKESWRATIRKYFGSSCLSLTGNLKQSDDQADTKNECWDKLVSYLREIRQSCQEEFKTLNEIKNDKRYF